MRENGVDRGARPEGALIRTLITSARGQGHNAAPIAFDGII